MSYSYDGDGNLSGTATQTISYCYDALNRVTGKAYSAQSCPLSSPVVTYSYDPGTNGIGHLTSLTDQAASGSYTFEALGRTISEQRTLSGLTKVMSYEYNLDGSSKALHYPSGAAISHTPDSAARMISGVDSANSINYLTGGSYVPDGSLTGFASGHSASFSGSINAFSYNKRLSGGNR